MTIRDKRHVMEDKSFNIIRTFLEPWLIYDFRELDYGIDLFIRIAEVDKPVSPENFQIQLKSIECMINISPGKIFVLLILIALIIFCLYYLFFVLGASATYYQ